MSRYDDIINLPHHQSTKRTHMSTHDRAAQFAPFAALKGYEEAVIETARHTDSKAVLDENQIEQIDATLQYIADNLNSNININVTYYLPDKYKAGGAYLEYSGRVKRIEPLARVIEFDNGFQIYIDDVFNIEIE